MYYSLDEVEKIVGLNRRKIQEYEKAGLSPKPEQEHKKSHKLQYTKQHINDLYRLRFYHELGYKIPMIEKEFKDKSSAERNINLKRHISELEEKCEDLRKLIAIGKVMNLLGMEPADLFANANKPISYDELMTLLDAVSDVENNEADIDKYVHETLTSEDFIKLQDVFERLKQLYDLEQSPESDTAQYLIGDMYNILSKLVSGSYYMFFFTGYSFLPGTVGGEDLDDEIGEGFSAFFMNSMNYFYSRHRDNEVDKELYESFNNIVTLYMMKECEIESVEIMQQVERAYKFFERIKIMKKNDIISALRMYSSLFITKYAAEQVTPNQKLVARISFRIVSDAINHYCDSISKKT